MITRLYINIDSYNFALFLKANGNQLNDFLNENKHRIFAFKIWDIQHVKEDRNKVERKSEISSYEFACNFSNGTRRRCKIR